MKALTRLVALATVLGIVFGLQYVFGYETTVLLVLGTILFLVGVKED